MNTYAIRLDGHEHHSFLEYLDSTGGAYFIVREGHVDNPHMHAVVFSEKTLAAFRSKFVRQVLGGAHGNGAYSITKVKDLDKYERYMCKGASSAEAPDVVAVNGIKYSWEWIHDTHERYWATNEELHAKRAKLSVCDAVLAACRDAGLEWRSRERIAELYIRELVARDKVINIFALKSAINLIQIKLCPDDTAITDLAAQCV